MGQKKIMIVEDEFIIAMLIERMLKKLGHVVVGKTDSGEDAITQAKETKPDLILMDIKLKGALDGIETVEKIREFLSMPVIFISGNTDKLYDGKLQPLEYVDFLSKPIQLAQLKKSLAKLD